MSSFQKKQAVGQGLKSLLKNIDTDINNKSGAVFPQATAVVNSQRIALNKIQVNPNQPRKDFDEDALTELVDSIKLHDLIQPITVSKIGHDTYQIISGERRFRASQIAGLKDIPAYIRTVQNKQNSIELALLENLQRADLNAIEIALSYQQLIDECNLTHELLAERMSKDRSNVTNYLRLLKLPPSIQSAVRNNSISMGHARVISGADSIDRQLYIFNQIIENKLSVRQTEDLAKEFNNKNISPNKKTENKSNRTTINPIYKKIEDNIASVLNAKIDLLYNEKTQKGSITIHYFNNESLNEILKKIGVNAH